ncbi:ROK family protein [Pleomorphovibrio marinus]|uniref:ROK family protein n=1 Tax=Pleomorphovibrio marinus TaxID=2164132 RepID=UPI000E0BADBA|nr:ROK family protein [Pleomorphovibrio marinus]
MKNWVLGVDIGGSHISGAPVDVNAKVIDEQNFERVEVDALGSKIQILGQWLNLLNQFPLSSYSGMGIAMPAPFDYKNGIAYLRDQGKFSALYGMNIKAHFAEQLGIDSEKIIFTNDAAAFLQGEIDYRGLEDSSRLMGITLGTGLGTAFRLEGMAEDAELWSSPFRDLIAEDYLGTNWFKTWSSVNYGLEINGLKPLLEEVDRAIAEEALREFGQNLGEFLVPHLKEKGIDTLIVGGNISKAANLFLPHTIKIIENADLSIGIHISKLGELASKYGAASIWQKSRSSKEYED